MTSQTHIHVALLRGIKVQQLGILISRKQQPVRARALLCRSAAVRGPAAAHISSVIILTVFAQRCRHMFHNLRRLRFNLPGTLGCGHSCCLDLLIQLVFFDAPSSPLRPLLLFSPPTSSAVLSVYLPNLQLFPTAGPRSGNQSGICGSVFLRSTSYSVLQVNSSQ